MAKILVIGYVWPEPASSAAGSRMMQLLDFFLSEAHQIVFATTAKETMNMINLGEKGISPEKIKLNDPSFDEFLSEFNPEIVLFDRFMMEEQFGWRVDAVCPEAIKILDTEDLHFLRKARELSFKKGIPEEDIYYDLDLTKREISAIYRCDLSLIISEVELSLLQGKFQVPGSILLYLPYLIEIPNSREIEALASYRERKDFVCIGNFLHAPNWDAVLYLRERIWPGIRKMLPGVNMNIYGAYPAEKNLQLNDPKNGFVVHGWAKSSSAVLQQARICLAPLRFGAGLKGKFIEAMQNGTPSITTGIGAEGINPNDSWPGFVEKDEENLILRAVELYQNESLWCEKQRIGFEILRKRFDKTRHSGNLKNAITRIEKGLETHRNSNFTGKMLKHHLHRSTYFMSRFIEEKNRHK